MSAPLWKPSKQSIERANINRYQKWLSAKLGLHFSNYHELWQWSIDHIEDFWGGLWSYFNIMHDGSYKVVRSAGKMPGIRWFEGTKINYAEHLFRNVKSHAPAILYAKEDSPIREMSWSELVRSTSLLQHFFIDLGIKQGDCIAAYVPNGPEATIAFLATNSLGAIWSSCSPDFGTQAVIDRFAQIKPKLIIAVSEYRYAGNKIDKKQSVEAIAKAIPSIKTIVWLCENSVSSKLPHDYWKEIIKGSARPLRFLRVPFNHPMWVLYSSGTTGLPKAIVHSHGGVLLEQLKYYTFHHDIQPNEKCFWYTTTGWMMWNHIQASLLCGGIMVLYDGSPSYPNLSILWKLAHDIGIHRFGTSAGYIMANKKNNICPEKMFELNSLREISATGSVLPPDGFRWIYKEIKSDVWLTSMSGGTDVCSAFVGGNPLLPVYEGEIQCITLGCALNARDEQGKSVQKGTMGEMVITKPMPSMPIYLWDDDKYMRYKKSYFEHYPSVWKHGDRVTITSRNGVIIGGRSDATLNRGGIRIGTSEIYRSIAPIAAIEDSLIICVEKEKGSFYMPLFIVLKEGAELSDTLKSAIKKVIRENYSPRHVPDEIVQAPDIPYTMSGKKTEVPIKKIFMGHDIKKAINKGTLRNPKSLKFYIDFYREKYKKDKKKNIL